MSSAFVHSCRKFIMIELMNELNKFVGNTLRDLGLSVATPPDADRHDEQPDLFVSLPTSTDEAVAVVDVMHRASVTPVELEKWRSQHPAEAILGFDYVSPALARRLRAAGIDYVDGTGNAHISRPGLHIHVEGRRPDRATAPPALGRHPHVLGPASLRVVFALLVEPALAGATFDDVADVAGVAKGTVHNTLNELTAREHLTGHRRNRHLLDVPRLAELWVDGFATQLLPRLDQQVLAGPDPQWWTKPTHHSTEFVLGGGLALAHYGGSLRLDTTIVYGAAPWAAARKLGRLTSDGTRNVILRERFWSPRLLPDAQFVPPLLAYAEALADGDSRAVEVARDLRNQGLIQL